MGKKEVDKHSFLKLKHPVFKLKKTSGERSADFITKWAGSWAFIILFFIFLTAWILTNGYFLLRFIWWKEVIDLYPFILLNLALSCLAAIQAPVILMSQNRENQRDRLRAQYDYAVNRKAEKEIREIKNILLKLQKRK